jgi:hypothetical protein
VKTLINATRTARRSHPISARGAGLTATASTDLWGRSKNLMLYVKPTTLRETANGYAVHTSRASIQRVVSEFARPAVSTRSPDRWRSGSAAWTGPRTAA